MGGRFAPETNPRTRTFAMPTFRFVAELGRIVEIRVWHSNDGTERLHKFKREPLLLWSKRSKSLLWSPSRKPSRSSAGAPRTAGAAEAFERWNDDGREAKSHRTLRGTRGLKLPRLGAVTYIAYRSDKFGSRTVKTYEHPFTSRVSTYGTGTFLVLRGGRLNVTADGIVG